MPVILVVDDSKVDQKLIGHLIEREDIDWIVEFANSAEEALVRLQSLAVDILVTDMRMPGMDGLGLLHIVRKRYKQLPVVVVTGQGSEELAAEALRHGAASYVPKAELVTRLNETIKQVLEVNSSRRSYDTLMDRVEEVHLRLNLDNQLELVTPLVCSIQHLLGGLKICGQEGQRRVGIALDEAVLNAVCHGNMELNAQEMLEIRNHLRDNTRCEWFHARRQEMPYASRHVIVDIQVSPTQALIKVSNEGTGFDPSLMLDHASSESSSGKSSRGLVLIRALMDEVTFNERGTELTMVKRRETADDRVEQLIPVD